MAMSDKTILIIGCGPGSPDYVTPAARQAVARTQVLVGSRRLLALFADYPGRTIPIDGEITAAMDAIAAAVADSQVVGVLVSGDPGLYSLARGVVQRFGRGACEVVPGVSSLQLAFARLGLDWADARWLSAHGRTPELAVEELARLDKIAILAGTGEAVAWTAQAAKALRATHEAWLCENLSLEDERVGRIEPERLTAARPASLAIILLVRRSLL